MADKKSNEKKTDKDFRPDQGQQSNENWDDDQSTDNPKQNEGSDIRATDESRNTSGYGSGERNKKDESVGPLDADFEELPSQKRSDRGSNLTGPGLG